MKERVPKLKSEEFYTFRHADAFEMERNLREGGFIEEAYILKKIVDICKRIKEVGGRAFLVGGSVRDELMGIPPKDFDIEVYNIKPEILKNLISQFGQINEVGFSFGILKLRIDDFEIDISLPRRETKTGRGHRDFAVNTDPYMDPKEAARRRDFTINALLKDPLSGEIYDFFGGIKDIQERTLKIVDEKTFREDPLRVLRGVQFVGRFGLRVDDLTSQIMREMRSELKYLPKERLREEWIKLFLKSPKPSLGLQVAMEWGIFHEIHPEIVKLSQTPQDPEWHPEGDVWIHTLMVVDESARLVREERLEQDDALLVLLSAFCHDFGKIHTTKEISGKIRSPGHEEAGKELTRKFLSEIGIKSSIKEGVVNLVGEHLKPNLFYIEEMVRGNKITDGAIKRLVEKIRPAKPIHLIILAEADYLGRGSFAESSGLENYLSPKNFPAKEWFLERVKKLGILETRPTPVLRGRDLIAFGFKPDKLFREIIDLAEQLHIQGVTRDEILRIVDQYRNTSLEDLIEGLKNKLKNE